MNKSGQQVSPNAPLLATKFYIPPSRENGVARPFLLQKLHDGINQRGSFSLISGPAGFGKTTLLSEFVQQRQQPTAWLSLDEADNDPERFWRYLIHACQTVLANVGQAALDLLSNPQPLPDETIPTLLINDLAAQKESLILVLDDYHEIHNVGLHNSLLFLLEYLPPNLHIIIATRIDPPWPLVRFRARNQLNEIRAQDLRFNAVEATAFLNETMGLDVSAQDAAALEARTEGWIAGLQLAALSLQGRSDVADFIAAFTGSHIYVADYLLTEILHKQPEAVQLFLRQTAILERLNAELCTAVSQNLNSQAILTDLHRANIFIVPLDNEGHWFRYHHLFADLLRARLPQALPAEAVAGLHTKAAAWYEQQGMIPEAIHHALAAQDFATVASLVEQEARTMMFSGQVSALQNWLNALPVFTLQNYPRLQIYQLWIEMMQEKVALSPHVLREKEALLRALPASPENEQLQVELLAILSRFVAFSGDSAWAIQMAEEALARLPQKEMALRARAHSALAVAHWIAGNPEQSSQAYAHCLRLARATGNLSLAAHAMMMQGMGQIDYGQLPAAARTYQAIIEMGEQAGQKPFFPAGQGHIGLAGVYLEWNDLATAVTHLQQGMKLCRQGGLAGLSFGHTYQARLYQAQGDFPAAAAELALLGETGADPTGTARQILLHMALGDLGEAARLAHPWLTLLDDAPSPIQPPLLVLEIIKVTLARLFLAQGALDRALKLLDEVAETAAPQNRNGRLLEVYLFKALAIQKQNQGNITAEARQYLERALELAEPAGVVLLFVEVGAVLVGLLTAVAHSETAVSSLKNYAQKLLNALAGSDQPAASDSPALVEQLTSREMEVLVLVVAGDANQAIADKLFITVRTVKKHMTSILGKLGVSNRTQAAARARELGLLPSD